MRGARNSGIRFMPMKIEKYSLRRAGSLLFLACATFFSCGRPAHNADGVVLADSSIQKGEVLATRYCQSCHQLPDPGLLDKRSWQKGVLPAMGPRLGIFGHNGYRYPSLINDPDVGRGFYPSAPLLAHWQWQEIIDYYTGVAPDSMPPQPEHPPIRTGLTLFEPMMPGSHSARPMTTYVHIDTSGGRRQILTGSMYPGVLMRYDQQLRLLDSVPLRGGIVDMQYGGDSAVACNIGNINPNDQQLGSLERVFYDKGGKIEVDSVPILRKLYRPVQVTAADLNGDHRTDFLVCEFGNQKGALSWWENNGNGSYTRHILRAQPGAIRAYVRDANGDGLPDIWVLFAQGDEGIFLYINKGGGRFEEHRLLTFPPVYGSSYFELADFNKDGYPDIVYTCGDNADYSVVPKPYHGIYIYLNDGHNRFTKSYFYPMNGCYKAIARDFDGDGDLDIAAIAFFADFKHQPEQGFLYLQNEGGMNFQPFTLPEAELGRWIVMDAGDLDGDGRPDLILGNFSMGPSLSKGKTDWTKGPRFLVLRNTGK